MKTTELDPLVSPDDADVIPIADVSESATKKLSIGDLKAAIGGGGDASTWSQYPATQDVDMDGHDVVGLPSYDPAVDPPPSDMSAAVSALTMNNAFNFLLPQWASYKASQDVDMDGHDVVGLPTYSGSSPPADLSAAASFATVANAMTETVAVWATAPASQDVDMDGNKITNLGAPTDAADAATKQYVDTVAGAAPTKIENGTSRVEIASANGDIEIYRAGKRVAFFWSGNGGRVILGGPSGAGLTLPEEVAAHALIRSGGYTSDFTSAGYLQLPSGVASYMHGVHLAKAAYDALASMPALPDLEWWEPVWTPVSNVDSASNVECSYTRAYRAAGGSLVTLEGTITVEIDEDDAITILSAPLPVPATSTGTLLAPAIGVDLARGDLADVRAGVTDMGSGPVLMISAGELSNATGVPATLTIGFRISYRAA